mgnify:CR=1 FL=1
MSRFALLLLILATNRAAAEVIRFKDMPYEALNSLLHLDLSRGADWKASGFYSINESGALDGPFDARYEVKGHDDELNADYHFKQDVYGSFQAGTEIGVWRYEFVYDDGIDYFQDHTITITHNAKSCSQSTFDGRIGYLMPQTRHVFTKPALCTPDAVLNEAHVLWKLEYENQRKNGDSNHNAPAE